VEVSEIAVESLLDGLRAMDEAVDWEVRVRRWITSGCVDLRTAQNKKSSEVAFAAPGLYPPPGTSPNAVN
jgi:hypothetical protein